jgi:hypothetical protein
MSTFRLAVSVETAQLREVFPAGEAAPGERLVSVIEADRAAIGVPDDQFPCSSPSPMT